MVGSSRDGRAGVARRRVGSVGLSVLGVWINVVETTWNSALTENAVVAIAWMFIICTGYVWYSACGHGIRRMRMLIRSFLPLSGQVVAVVNGVSIAGVTIGGVGCRDQVPPPVIAHRKVRERWQVPSGYVD